jgi:hypothetical protein
MIRRQIPSSPSQNAQSIVEVDEDYVVSTNDETVDAVGPNVTVTLPASPIFGVRYRIVASGGSVNVDGNGHPIEGGGAVAHGLALELIFSASSTWVPVGSTGSFASQAFIFDGPGGGQPENGRTNRTVGQSPIDNTKRGIINMGSGSGPGVTGDFGTLSGGSNNSVEALFATVSGGGDNHATGISGTVSGGDTNRADGLGATVGGGGNNTASGDRCVIAGGVNNSISVTAVISSILGGNNNSILTDLSTIGGGFGNTIRTGAQASVIGGGWLNQTLSPNSCVPGGRGAIAKRDGQEAFADGVFSALGDAQWSRYMVRGTSTNGSSVPLMDNQASNLDLEPGHAYAIQATLLGLRTDAGGTAMLKHTILAHNSGGGAVIDQIISDPANATLINGQTWTIAYAPAGNDIVATFTGTAGQTVRATVKYEWSEIGGGA